MYRHHSIHSVLGCSVIFLCCLSGCGSKTSPAAAESATKTGWCGVDSAPDPASPGVALPRLTWQIPITVRRGNSLPDREWGMIKKAMTSWSTASGRELFSLIEEPEDRDGNAFPNLDAPLGDKINSNYFETSTWTARTGKESGVLATTVFQNTGTGPEADIRYNNEHYNYGDANSDKTIGTRYVADIETVALHELGHLLSLAHIEETVDATSAMKATIEVGPNKTKRILSTGDSARIKALHGL